MVVSSPLLASLIDQVQTELSRDNASEAKKLLLKANSNNHSNSATTDNSLNDNDQSILLTLFGIVEMELLDCPTTSTSSSSSLVQDSHHIETSIQRAKSYFLRAVQSMPDSGYEKYLYLGQLCVGVDAVKCYEKGVEIIQQEMSDRVAGRGEGGGVGSGDDDEELAILRTKASSSLCALIEMYMTDLCDEPNAESQCEVYIQQAISIAPNNPEVYQTLASIRLSQAGGCGGDNNTRMDEAKQAALHSLNLWINNNNSNMNNINGDITEEVSSSLSSSSSSWPAYPVRLSLAKLLIELQDYPHALTVLETLQREDDEDPEIWYLFAWCYYLAGGGVSGAGSEGEIVESCIPLEQRVENWDDSKDCLMHILELLEKYGDGSMDQDIVNHSRHLLSIINPFLEKNSITSVVGEDVKLDDSDCEEDGDDQMEM